MLFTAKAGWHPFEMRHGMPLAYTSPEHFKNARNTYQGQDKSDFGRLESGQELFDKTPKPSTGGNKAPFSTKL